MIAALYFGSETRTFKSKEEAQKHIERDAADIAAERGGEVVDYGNGDDIEEVVNRLAAIGYALEDALSKA